MTIRWCANTIHKYWHTILQYDGDKHFTEDGKEYFIQILNYDINSARWKHMMNRQTFQYREINAAVMNFLLTNPDKSKYLLEINKRQWHLLQTYFYKYGDAQNHQREINMTWLRSIAKYKPKD